MKRVLLTILSAIAVGLLGVQLFLSWFEPPPQTRLDLFQTNLVLNATPALADVETSPWARAFANDNPLDDVIERYQTATDKLDRRLERMRLTLAAKSRLAGNGSSSSLASMAVQLQSLQSELDELRLRTGVLLAEGDRLEDARPYWDAIETSTIYDSATAIAPLWTANRVAPEAETVATTTLDGWFQSTALDRMYSLENRAEDLNRLREIRQVAANEALHRLVAIAGLPVLGIGVGSVILLVGTVLLWQRRIVLFGSAWQIPWDGLTIQGTMTVWFLSFLLVSLLVPTVYLGVTGAVPGKLSNFQQAMVLLLTYVTAAGFGLALIAAAARPHRPLDDTELLRLRWGGRWPLWSIGGYFAALPLVLLAATLSQWLLPDSGGGNPILPIVLESQTWVPRAIFFSVVAIAAPLFEETLFRGFFLTSLTKYLPVWGAVLVSGFVFAAVHLNLADLLPLTVLGVVMGTIYSRTRNLLAPMLLHSLWNTGSFVALLVLGGG